MSKESTLYFIMREALELVTTVDGHATQPVTRICCAVPLAILYPAATWRTVEEVEVLVLGVHSAAYLGDMLPWFTDSKEVARDYKRELLAREREHDGGNPMRYTAEEIHYTSGALNVTPEELRQACMAAEEHMAQHTGGW